MWGDEVLVFRCRVYGQQKSADSSSPLLVSDSEESASTWSDEVLNAVHNTAANVMHLHQPWDPAERSTVEKPLTLADDTVSGLYREGRYPKHSAVGGMPRLFAIKAVK